MTDVTPQAKLEVAVRALLGGRFPSAQEIRDQVAELRPSFPGVTEEDAASCIAAIEASLGVSMDLGSQVVAPGHVPWLSGRSSEIDWYYRDRYHRMLETEMPPKVMAGLDQVTDRILNFCGDPAKDGPWDRRGMVVGNVQSGKTSNYTGLICKAADAGYRLIVVIAGVHNNLRNQTQERIDAGFVGMDSSRLFAANGGDKIIGVGTYANKRRPASFTSSVKDFNKAAATNLGISIEGNQEPVVFVIKKNSATLRNLTEWLVQHNTAVDGQKITMPMLLIDDEADNASINIAYGKGAVSRINGQLRELLGLFERSSYVGYTATPFANIFIDPDTDDEMAGDDLFPRDFIVSLDPPSNYVGPERIFVREPSNFLLSISDAETTLPLSHKIDHEVTELPDSLVDAIRSFIVARSARLARGHRKQHMSMLVNASRFTRVQDEIRRLIFLEWRRIEAAVRIDGSKPETAALKNPDIAALKIAWEALNDKRSNWKTVQSNLLDAVSSIQVVAINNKSSDALDYSSSEPGEGRAVIAVGGFSLSRGLTLEGLMVSYFYRRSLMYDTLMQMGRWFGYREGYDDLCRIWMSEEAQGWFEHITESVEMLRAELRSMDVAGLSPKDFGLKVRSHPDALLITARNKSGSGESIPVQIGLANHMIETTALDADSAVLDGNRDVAAALVSALKNEVGLPEFERSRDGGRYLVKDVSPELVIDFVRKFKNHPGSPITETGPVIKYIESRKKSTLPLWDVAIVGVQNGRYVEDECLGVPLIPQHRTVGKRSDSSVILITNKQRVGSRGIEKLGLSPSQVKEAERDYDLNEQGSEAEETAKSYPDRIYRAVRDKPLLLVHLLRLGDPDDDEAREALKAQGFKLPLGPVVAWGISFPDAPPGETEKTVAYVVNSTWLKSRGQDFDDDYGDEFDDE